MTDSATWPYVLEFAEQMERKLAQNRHKGDRDGWINDTPLGLLGRLREEVEELYLAVASGGSSETVTGEAADVANFAMMIADVVREWDKAAPVALDAAGGEDGTE